MMGSCLFATYRVVDWFALKLTKYEEKLKYLNLSANCSSRKVLSVNPQFIFTKKIKVFELFLLLSRTSSGTFFILSLFWGRTSSENSLRGWHLVILRADQSKNTLYDSEIFL